MIIGYVDPPYPGCAHLYKDHPDFAGEVDHTELIARLERDFDGWVLHTNTPAIPLIASLVPANARWGAWVKSFAAFKPNVMPCYAWEPVIFKPVRKAIPNYSRGSFTHRDWVQAPIAMRGFVGSKPAAVCHWAFEIIGAQKDDTLIDLFPGSGAVSRAWETWRPQLDLWQATA